MNEKKISKEPLLLIIMKIVIAGGTGFLGKSLISYWQDHEIIVLTRKLPAKSPKSNDHVKYVTWNPTSIGDWVQQLDQVDVIINLVGQSLASGLRWTKGLKKKLVESRTLPTKTLASAVDQLTTKPKFFIQVSGVNYYDFSFDEQNESSPVGPTFLSTLTVDWEAASASVDQSDVKRIVLRLAPVISKQSLLIKLLRLPYRLFAGGRYGLRGDQWFSWIDVDDFVGFIDFALTNNIASGAYNLSSPNPLQNKDMNRIIGKNLKRPWFFPVPGFVLKIVLGQKSDLLLKSVRVVSTKIPEVGYSFKYTNFEECFRKEMAKKKL